MTKADERDEMRRRLLSEMDARIKRHVRILSNIEEGARAAARTGTKIVSMGVNDNARARSRWGTP